MRNVYMAKLAKELRAMAEADQKMRRRADKTGSWDFSIDKRNVKRLKEVIKKYGWPTIDLVGKKGSKAAWLIAQHADHDVPFQKRRLKLMEELDISRPGSIERKWIPLLVDRVLTAEGKKQIFGTQFFLDKKGKLKPKPIKDIKNIEKRRSSYGMHPFAKDLEEAELVSKTS